ncbi:MAG: protein-disulfide reductase DsbD domain-containing protein [Nitrospinota bacterium]
MLQKSSLAPIKVSALTSKSVVSPGEGFKFHLSIFVEGGWHIYSLYPLEGNELLATQIRMENIVFTAVGDWEEPNPVLIQDGAVGKMVKGHKGNIEFVRSYQVPPEAVAKKYTIEGKLIYRACDNQICNLPQEIPFHTSIEVHHM